jgi:iron complex outermembrane receptor protein
MRATLFGILILLSGTAAAAQNAALHIEVRSGERPVAGAQVVVNGTSYTTDAEGAVTAFAGPGAVEIVVVKEGFAPASASVVVAANQEQPVTIELTRGASVEEHVTVSATRTDRGIEDQPMRVEVVDTEEIGEKVMMTPGDVVMLLNETAGMRVQATSPSLGAASVRVQGMRGRYTRFLADGLPLFGEQVSLGLMQVPPLDLNRVEVIKGVASSLYGAGAMAGVVNLVSKRPGAKVEDQIVVNRSSRGATDAGFWSAMPLSPRWGMTVVGSVNGQQRTDVDGDGWADLAKYTRAVVRPRLFWDNRAGSSIFVTGSGTFEDRTGGTMPGATLAATGREYIEALGTRRSDIGTVLQTTSPGGVMWSARASWTWQRQTHTFGDAAELDTRTNGFAELTVRRAIDRHTLVGGLAIERDAFHPVTTPQFAYTFTTPGLFVQDDFDVAGWLAVSASGRVDRQSTYGTFLSPRVSALVHEGPWSSRLSLGAGFAAPTPLTEETEAAGLTHLVVAGPLKAERGRNLSLDITRSKGPLSTTATFFHSTVRNPVEVERTERFTLGNLLEPTINAGLETLAVWKTDDFSIVANYAYVRSRETVEGARVDVPLTPRHSVGIDGAWESEGAWRVGVEWYYTGVQRLEANPYRDESRPYSLFGVLASRRIGRAVLFVNGENLTGVRQTTWDPLLRPTRGVDGRWTVDAWAPLDGRNVNGGLRVTF